MAGQSSLSYFIDNFAVASLLSFVTPLFQMLVASTPKWETCRSSWTVQEDQLRRSPKNNAQYSSSCDFSTFLLTWHDMTNHDTPWPTMTWRYMTWHDRLLATVEVMRSERTIEPNRTGSVGPNRTKSLHFQANRTEPNHTEPEYSEPIFKITPPMMFTYSVNSNKLQLL